MARKYMKEYPKTTLYKYEFTPTSDSEIKVTPVQADVVIYGFAIRDEEHSYMDKRIKNNQINCLKKSGSNGKYTYTMYSVTNDDLALKGFLERILICTDRDYTRAERAWHNKYKVHRTVCNHYVKLERKLNCKEDK